MKRIGMIYIRLQTLVIAIALIGAGLWQLCEMLSFLAIAETTEGIVVDYKRSDRRARTMHNKNEHFYTSVIAFRHMNRRVHLVLSDASSTLTPTVGERVTVHYDPADPKNTMTDMGTRWLAIIASFTFGFFCFSALLVMDWERYQPRLARLLARVCPPRKTRRRRKRLRKAHVRTLISPANTHRNERRVYGSIL